MKKLIKNLSDKADKIAKLMLADVIDDVDLLTVALSATGLHEIASTLSYAQKGEVRYTAAHQALDVGWNPDWREKLRKEEYLSKGVAGLLEVAKNNPDAGSRLMPVFEEVLDQYKDFGISKKLRCELKNYMNQKLKDEGFSIAAFTDEGEVIVKTATWVNEKVRDNNR